jgi:hypothetical protein
MPFATLSFVLFFYFNKELDAGNESRTEVLSHLLLLFT